jgi:RDD family
MRSAGRIEVAGMRRRAVSLAIDAAVASALGLAAALLLQRLTPGHPRFLAVIVGVVAAPLYFIPQWAVGRSVGMWLLHLELVRQDNGGRPGLARSVVRLAMWVVDLAVENVIFLMTAPGDLQKRAPHDLVSRTVVIRSRGGKGRFWELSWADWLTHHHDERPFMDRMSDRSGRHIRFVVGSRRRVAVAITVGIFIYGGGAVVALLGLRARPAREFQVVADLVSLLMITGAIVLARFRLSRPGAAKPPKPRRYVVGGWASAGLSTALAAGAAVAAIHRSWVILAVALYIAALSALLAYGCVRAARIFADPSRRLPKDVIDKITTFPRVSPVAQAYRVTLVLRDGRRVRRVMVAYGGLVFSIGRWRTRLDFRPADAVDALNEVRDGAPATASSRV